MLGPRLVSMAPAPAMDAEDRGGGGARNQSGMVVKTGALCTNGDLPLVVSPDLSEDQGADTIECSSSFGDTSSGFEGDADGGEPEVNSATSARANGGGSSKQPRRKKVTAEWRNYVLPVLWRCQWLELRMKELSSQVSKYDRELALIKKEKELQQAVSKANGSMPELMQIHKGHGNSIMERRKRKRHEENVNTSLYINKHKILSYYHDKQHKGAETGGLLIDGDCDSTVSGSIRGELDTVTLLNSENYDIIYEQLTLKDTLMTIDGLQSRVHLLQDRLSKAHSEGKNLTLFEDNTHVRVPRKRQHTQKRSFSYTKCQYTKPQKKKNLNSLLKDDGGSALAGRPALPGWETNMHIRDANRNAEERSGECNHSREKAVRMDLLLGTDIFVRYGHIGDLCRENTDDILIDNQAANEACQQFDKAKHLPSGTSSKGQNISAPLEVKNTYAPSEIDSTSAPAVEPVSPQSKQALKTKKRRKKRFFSTKKQRKESSKTPAAKDKTDGTPSAAKNKTGSTTCAMTAEKTEGKPSGAMGSGTMTARSAGNKCQIGNEPADVKKRESGSNSASNKQKTENPSAAAKKQKTENPSAAAKKQKTENPSSAAKKQKTENPSSTAKKQKTENPSSATKKQEAENPSSTPKEEKTENLSATKETETMPLNLKIDNEAVLVAVNSRRSQRVRKPKVFAD